MTAQYAIDGKPGKSWKVMSPMGWRIHPIHHDRRFHLGTDIWSSKEPCYIEAPYAGKVLTTGYNGSGYGYYVVLRHKIKGEFYTTLYAHMAQGSVKVKKGQKVEAGTVLGKMGTTGASTGKHLHWELSKGKTHVWNSTGKNYIEPVKFFTNLIEWEKSIAEAKKEAKPEESNIPTVTVESGKPEVVVEPPVSKTEEPKKPAAKPAEKSRPVVKLGSKGVHVKHLQNKLGITADGDFGKKTEVAVVAFQKKHGLNPDGVVGPRTWKVIG